MRATSLGPYLLAASLLPGCASEEGPQGQDYADSKADQISGKDDPSGLMVNAERRLAKLVSEQDVGETFGLSDEKAPYPDTYWPMVDNGIAVEWLEKSGRSCSTANECNDPAPSPLAKFMALTDPDSLDEAVAWEIKHHGKDVPEVKDWFGHCPGWAGSAQMHAPLTGPTSFAPDGQGGVRKCESGEEGCTVFEIGDMNGLMAEVFNNARSRFIGARCDTEPADIERDEFGRIVRNGKGCQGLNAGSMFLVASNLLKLDKKAFNIDAQNEFNTEQIWNQPAYRYTVHGFEHLTEGEAANLVASGGESREGSQNRYLWNSAAKGYALVDFDLHWITETRGPNLTMVSGTQQTRKTRMLAVLELNAPADDSEAEIIGGEYLNDARTGADRLRVQPFAWVAFDVGSDFGGGHNPFIKGQIVKDMIALALGNAGEDSCAHDMCTEGDALDASCSNCASTVCGEDAFCCTQSWDEQCVSEAAELCAATCE